MSKERTIAYCQHDSPVGPLLLGGPDGQLGFIHFPKDGQVVAAKSDWMEDASAFDAVRFELDGYFAGTLSIFTVPYHVEGSDFQNAVWQALANIPYGQVRSYGDIAKAVGQPGGARAVGLANNANPLPIIIPCHRVIVADGSLVGFGGGMKIKIWLLEHEGITPSQVHTPDQMGLPF